MTGQDLQGLDRSSNQWFCNGFAPRFIDVTDTSDQGKIVLDEGVTIKGRVLDRKGSGLAGTIVGMRNVEHRLMFAYMAVIGTAVRTDPQGYFQLPPLRGSYTLTVSQSVPDFSRQMMLVGTKPPEIEPLIIDVDEVNPDELVILRAK